MPEVDWSRLKAHELRKLADQNAVVILPIDNVEEPIFVIVKVCESSSPVTASSPKSVPGVYWLLFIRRDRRRRQFIHLAPSIDSFRDVGTH